MEGLEGEGGGGSGEGGSCNKVVRASTLFQHSAMLTWFSSGMGDWHICCHSMSN